MWIDVVSFASRTGTHIKKKTTIHIHLCHIAPLTQWKQLVWIYVNFIPRSIAIRRYCACHRKPLMTVCAFSIDLNSNLNKTQIQLQFPIQSKSYMVSKFAVHNTILTTRARHVLAVKMCFWHIDKHVSKAEKNTHTTKRMNVNVKTTIVKRDGKMFADNEVLFHIDIHIHLFVCFFGCVAVVFLTHYHLINNMLLKNPLRTPNTHVKYARKSMKLQKVRLHREPSVIIMLVSFSEVFTTVVAYRFSIYIHICVWIYVNIKRFESFWCTYGIFSALFLYIVTVFFYSLIIINNREKIG